MYNDVVLLNVFALAIIGITFIIARSFNLLKIIIFLSVYSLMLVMCYLLMDAPDVAMTEAVIGSFLSTLILLEVASKVKSFKPTHLFFPKNIIAILFISIFAVLLILAGYDFAQYGNPLPLHQHINRYYIENTQNDIGIPSFVAAILASYRGYDTLGETTVILIAGVCVLYLFSKNKKNV